MQICKYTNNPNVIMKFCIFAQLYNCKYANVYICKKHIQICKCVYAQLSNPANYLITQSCSYANNPTMQLSTYADTELRVKLL